MALHGAEQILTNEQLKRVVKHKFQSAAARYIPGSLQEIQAGIDLEIAKQTRVSFDPDVDYEETAEENQLDRSDPDYNAENLPPSTADTEDRVVNEVGAKHKQSSFGLDKLDVADVTSALVLPVFHNKIIKYDKEIINNI